MCPAPCEAACTLNIDDVPVTIKTIECAIADRGFEEGWIAPEPPETKTGKRIAIVGSGPAGLAAAQQLARAGHDVHVYEKNAKPGGLLRYGIPDFKMEKGIIDRRVKQMEAEGVTFHCNVARRQDRLRQGARGRATTRCCWPAAPSSRSTSSPNRRGRDLDGIHFAMDFLPQQNRRVCGEVPPAITDAKEILAKDKHVIVIGGGDTGSDCIGTSFRQGAKSVTQLEIMPMPPEHENKALSWPNWPLKLRISSSQAEGAKVEYSVSTTGFSGEHGKVKKLHYVQVDNKLQPVPGTDAELDADLVLFAMGFSGPVEDDVVKELALPVVAARALQGRSTRTSATTRSRPAEGVRRRRHPPRAVARRVGDPRRPPGRAGDRQVPDGQERAAAVSCAALSASAAVPFGALSGIGGGSLRTSAVVCWRGQVKSSARPGLEGRRSPFSNTRK